MSKLLNWIAKNYLILIFLISGAATFGSLYFSEVQALVPCIYCWYARIFMYPIFIISTVSLSFTQAVSKKILLALVIPGTIIGAYHFYIQTFPDPNRFVPCVGGVDCSKIDWTLQQVVNLDLFKYVTIPFLSLMAFVMIGLLIAFSFWWNKRSV